MSTRATDGFSQHHLLNPWFVLHSVNKQLLLNVERFLEVIVDSLLLDLEHPKAAQPDFETIKIPVQRVRCERPALYISLARPS